MNAWSWVFKKSLCYTGRNVHFAAMLRTGLWMFLARVFQGLLNLGLMVLVSRWLVPADRGTIGVYLMVIALVLAVAEMAAGSTVVVLLGKLALPAALRVYTAWSVLISMGVVAAAYFLEKVAAGDAVLLSLASLLQALLAFALHVVLGKGRTAWYCAALVLSALLPGLFFFGFAHIADRPQLEHWLWGLVAGWSLTGLIVAGGVGFFLQQWQRWLLPDASMKVWSAMFGRGILNQGNHLVTLTHNRLPYLLLPAASLGVYANAVSLGESVLLLSGSLGTALYAQVAARPDQARRALSPGFLALAMLLSGVGFLCLLALPAGFYAAVFGEAYRELPGQLQPLVSGLWMYSGYLLLSYWYSGQDRFGINLQAGMLGLLACTACLVVGHLMLKQPLTLHFIIQCQTLGWVVMAGRQLVGFVRIRSRS